MSVTQGRVGVVRDLYPHLRMNADLRQNEKMGREFPNKKTSWEVFF